MFGVNDARTIHIVTATSVALFGTRQGGGADVFRTDTTITSTRGLPLRTIHSNNRWLHLYPAGW